MAEDQTVGLTVVTNKTQTSNVVYAAHGQLVVQYQEDTVTEFRGLDENSAKTMAKDDSYSSDFKEKIKYARFGEDQATINLTCGVKTSFTARRANEAGMWTVIKTESKYSHSDLNGNIWKDDPASSRDDASDASVLAKGWKVVSCDRSVQEMFKAGGDPICSVTDTEVSEITGLTERAAMSLVSASSNNETSNPPPSMVCHIHDIGNGMSAWSWFMHGVLLRPSARFISDAEGWGVTLTKTTYSYIGNGWSIQS